MSRKPLTSVFGRCRTTGDPVPVHSESAGRGFEPTRPTGPGGMEERGLALLVRLRVLRVLRGAPVAAGRARAGASEARA